jgi:hypothetical protein
VLPKFPLVTSIFPRHFGHVSVFKGPRYLGTGCFRAEAVSQCDASPTRSSPCKRQLVAFRRPPLERLAVREPVEERIVARALLKKDSFEDCQQKLECGDWRESIGKKCHVLKMEVHFTGKRTSNSIIEVLFTGKRCAISIFEVQ